MQNLVQSTSQDPGDTLFLHIFNGEQLNRFEYYEDDGSTMDYQNGSYCRRTIEFDPAGKNIRLEAVEGSYPSTFSFIKLILHGFNGEINDLTVNNQPLSIKSESLKLLDGLKYLEAIYDQSYFKSLREEERAGIQVTFVIPWDNEEVVLFWR
jgi:alpha-glucosidase